MKKVFETVFNKSDAIQRVCDIGAKIVVIAVGGIILGKHLIERAMAKKSETEKSIGFKIRD